MATLTFEPPRTELPNPHDFLKRGTGLGSTGSRIIVSASTAAPSKSTAHAKPTTPLRRPRSVLFRKLYDRADLPCKVDHDRAGRTGLRWTLDPATLDISFFLPIFIDGLVETEEPYRMLSDRGITALLEACPQDVAGAIPRLILPLKRSLRSRDPATLRRGLATLRALSKCSPEAGAALVEYLRQLLPPLNHIMHQGPGGRWSGVDEGGAKSVYASVLTALRTVEAHGGSDALKAIKFNIPTYQRL